VQFYENEIVYWYDVRQGKVQRANINNLFSEDLKESDYITEIAKSELSALKLAVKRLENES
jgi:hypothetical protein